MDGAVFLDRDGVINELVYYAEHGVVDSPFTAQQFKLIPGASEAIKMFHELGFKVIIASNQPGMAKGYFSQETFDSIRQRMSDELAEEGASFEAEYYCFHHPEAKVEGLKANCGCRKPKPGLLLQAAKNLKIDLCQSWMIGDGLTDIQAGKSAGCRTILLGRMKCELCRLMDDQDARPDYVAANLLEAANLIKNHKSEINPTDSANSSNPTNSTNTRNPTD